MTKEQLIDRVLEQIAADVQIGDFTAIAELLEHVQDNILEGFLSEETA